ncbi:hypothetical protein BJY52DRAFT_1164758 [Lactarius psammicola]|nr:hypothetical protein BJY52DRAFT_1164758 [Lactarius psammicola]
MDIPENPWRTRLREADRQQMSPPRGPPPPYTSHQSTTHYVTATTFSPSQESAGRRFTRAFLVAMLIWLLTGALVSSCFDSFGVIRPGDISIPAVDDNDVDSCSSWTSIPDRAHPLLPSRPFGSWSRASFSLPVDIDTLYLVAHGALASGDLYVSESVTGKDVLVKVFVHYRDSNALSRATVCQLSRGNRQVGVGIFTPRQWHNNQPITSMDALHFVIQVELPVSRDAVRYIPSFQADLPMFALDMDDISAYRFGNVSLRSTNSHIEVRVIIIILYTRAVAKPPQGAIANTFNVHSTNGRISGAFNTTDSLRIVTTNSPVSVRIGAVNEKPEKPTEVIIQTTNGRIKADISLMSNSSSGTGGAFGVRTYTTNSPIEVVYEDSPVDSVLKFDAASTNSPVHASLHRAYEGTFALATINGGALLDRLRLVEDPSGQGRERSFTKRSVGRNRIFGKVEWAPSSDYNRTGSVDVATTNDMVTLTV